MKRSHSFLAVAVAALLATPLGARAEDPIPPKPPGSTTLPAAPAATTPNSPSSASEPGPAAGGRGRAGEFVQMLKEKVGVTDDQFEKMKPILGQQMEKIKGLREDASMTMEQKREKGREIFTSMIEQLKPILTPEQITKLKEEMEKRRAARQQKQG